MDKKIAEYRIVRAKVDEIDDEIMRQIRRGWQPFGSPFLAAFFFGMGVVQPMVKYEEIEEEEVITHVIEACETLLEKIETAMPQLKNSVWEEPKIEEVKE